MIPNIFYFNCLECKENRNCYGGNMPNSNQYKYCKKSAELLEKIKKFFDTKDSDKE